MEWGVCEECDTEFITEDADFVYLLCPACAEDDNIRVKGLVDEYEEI